MQSVLEALAPAFPQTNVLQGECQSSPAIASAHGYLYVSVLAHIHIRYPRSPRLTLFLKMSFVTRARVQEFPLLQSCQKFFFKTSREVES